MTTAELKKKYKEEELFDIISKFLSTVGPLLEELKAAVATLLKRGNVE